MPRAYISQWKSLCVCCWLLLQLYFSRFVLSSAIHRGVRVSCTRNLSRGIKISHYLVSRFVSLWWRSEREKQHTLKIELILGCKREMKAEIDNNYRLSEITQKKKQQIVSFFEFTNSIWIHRFSSLYYFFLRPFFKMFSFSIQIYSTLFFIFWNFKLFFFCLQWLFLICYTCFRHFTKNNCLLATNCSNFPRASDLDRNSRKPVNSSARWVLFGMRSTCHYPSCRHFLCVGDIRSHLF